MLLDIFIDCFHQVRMRTSFSICMECLQGNQTWSDQRGTVKSPCMPIRMEIGPPEGTDVCLDAP